MRIEISESRWLVQTGTRRVFELPPRADRMNEASAYRKVRGTYAQ